MKKLLPLLIVLFSVSVSMAQDDTRRLLRGTVLYRGSNVTNENVINTTSSFATITDANGDFVIPVKLNDEIVFTALNYQLKVVVITQVILDNNRLVVEVTEKVTELDEVVLSPENQERFIQMKNEEFKGYDYEVDRSTQVINIAQTQTERGMENGVNFVNLFKLLFQGNKNNEANAAPKKLLLSDIMRQVYDDAFFVVDLNVPQDKIDAFLQYCDAQVPPQELLKKSNEFQLIDFFVTQSKVFLAQVNEE